MFLCFTYCFTVFCLCLLYFSAFYVFLYLYCSPELFFRVHIHLKYITFKLLRVSYGKFFCQFCRRIRILTRRMSMEDFILSTKSPGLLASRFDLFSCAVGIYMNHIVLNLNAV